MKMPSIVAAAGIAAALASGCGSQPSAISVVTGAADHTTAAQTARVSENIHVTPSSGSSAAAQDITAEGTADFLLQQADLTTTVAGQQVEVIADNGTIYEKIAAVSAMTGKPWLKIDLNALGKVVGVKGLGDLMQSQSNDPTQPLQYLRGATGPITTVGHDTVRGTSTSHYRVTTDLTLAAKKLPAAQQATVGQIVALLGVHTTTIDVWVDAQGRARRFHYSFDYSAAKLPAGVPAGSVPKSMDITVELYDFGTSTRIAVPTSDQVADFAQLLNSAAKSASCTCQSSAPPVASASNASSAASTAIERLLITSVPAGFQQAPDSVGDTGPSDLAKAVRDSGHANATQVLTTAGFVAGYQRMWTLGKDQQIIEFIYQFGSGSGATTYGELTRLQESAPRSGDTIASFGVAAIPGAHGIAVVGTDGPAAMVMFAKGGYLTEIVVHGPSASPALATSLALQQYGRM